MHFESNRLFLQSIARDFKRTGAVAPSSKSLAIAMTSEMEAHYRPPVRVLEVGAGTGSITSEIARRLSAGDRLDVFEIDRRFAGMIRHRLVEDSSFRGVRATVRVYRKSIEAIERRPRYDFVLSCLPFTNFPARMVEDIFEIYRTVLKPGGICSFYEYLFLRRAARLVSGTPAERERVAAVGRVVRSYVDRFAYRHQLVFKNLPPAAVHHIRFPAGRETIHGVPEMV